MHELPHELPNDLRLRILGIRKFQESSRNAWIWCRVPSRTPKSQILTFLLKTRKKSAVKHSIQKPICLISWICLLTCVFRKPVFNPFRTAKVATNGTTNGNHRLRLKSKPQIKCHWSSRINLGRRGVHGLRALELGQSPQATPTAWKGPMAKRG